MSVEQAQVERVELIGITRVRALSSAWVAAASVSGFWIALILAIHRNSPRSLVSFHGLLHAAIAGQFLAPGSASFPPENPFYAGQPVAYYWFFQYLAAQLTRLLSLNIFHSLEALVLIGTGVLMVTAVFLGRRLYDSVLSGTLIGYLIIAGTNPLGWLFAVYQIARHGRSLIKDDPEHLWGVVHPIFSLMRYNDFGGIYGPLLSFFLNITSRPVALAGLLLMILFLHRSLVGGGSLAVLALGLASALTTAMSPIIGITAGGTLLVSLTALWLWDRRRTSEPGVEVKLRMKSKMFAGVMIGVGILIAAPTYYHLMFGPSANHLRFWLLSMEGLRHLITVGSSIFLLVVLAFVGLIRASREQRQFLLILIAAAMMLLGFEAVFTLPDGNGSNLFHAAVVLLAVPAAGSIVRTFSDKRSPIVNVRLAILILLAFLPTALLLVTTYVNRPPLPVSFQNETLARVGTDSDLRMLYEWVLNKTEQSAVFIVDPRDRIAVCGNSLEFPAMTQRAILTENSNHYMSEPYPDSETRFDLALRFSSGEKPSNADGVFLSKFSRPIYVVSYRGEDPALMRRMEENYGVPIFHQGTVAVYQWLAGPQS